MNILAQDIVYESRKGNNVGISSPYYEGLCRSPEAYENIISQPDQGFISSIAKYVWQLCIFVGILFFIHQIYEYLKKSFTTPIKTNLVQLYQNKYNEIVKVMPSLRSQHPYETLPSIASTTPINASDAKPYVRSTEGFGRTRNVAVNVVKASEEEDVSHKDYQEDPSSEELSTTQKEYLSRELLDIIHKSI